MVHKADHTEGEKSLKKSEQSVNHLHSVILVSVSEIHRIYQEFSLSLFFFFFLFLISSVGCYSNKRRVPSTPSLC